MERVIPPLNSMRNWLRRRNFVSPDFLISNFRIIFLSTRYSETAGTTRITPMKERDIFGEENHAHTLQKIVSGNWSLIRNKRDKSTELYNLAGDHKEEKNLAGKEKERVSKMTRSLKEWYERNTKRAVKPDGIRGGIAKRTQDALRALGYLEGTE